MANVKYPYSYACAHAFIHAHTHTHTRMHTHTHCTHMHTNTHMHTHMHTRMHTHAHTHAFIHGSVKIYMHTQIHSLKCLNISVDTNTCMHTYRFIHGNVYNATVNLFADLYMLFAAEQVIGTLSSNVGRLVGEMRQVYGYSDIISIDDQAYKQE
jgi:hypothetical protein